MKKRIISLLTVLALTLTGCSGTAPGSDKNAPEAETAATGADTTADSGQSGTSTHEIVDTNSPSSPDKDKIIALVTSSGGLDDESFNQSAWEGLQRTVGEYACTPLYMETHENSVFKENLDSVISDGADLCWGIGYSCAEDMLAAAESHPDISFAIIDNYYEDTPDNMTGVVFRAEEPSFIAGFIAANVTKTGKIGFVGGESNSVIEQFQYGYMGGVAYASNRLGSDVEVKAVYADTFTDEEKGKELAEELFDEGCDIVFHAAGQTGIGVIEAAEERGLYAIGVDKDQSYLAPDNVLTSVLKYVSVAMYTITGDFLNGGIIGGHTISLGLSENAVGISGHHTLYPDSVYEDAMKIRDEIVEGQIIPPSTEDEYEEFILQ